MDFRLAGENDLNQLAQMRWDYWVEGGSDPAKQEKQEFVDGFIEVLGAKLNQTWFVWCAVEDNEILSHVFVQSVEKIPKPSAPADAFGYVTNVCTRPSHRNCGIGSQLMVRVKEWAREQDLEFLVLWPNEPSIPFWQKVSFSVDDPLVFEIRPYVN
jgi:GNAT superfamily N-acetyltransferase